VTDFFETSSGYCFASIGRLNNQHIPAVTNRELNNDQLILLFIFLSIMTQKRIFFFLVCIHYQRSVVVVTAIAFMYDHEAQFNGESYSFTN
jgi:hypothetical protein